MPTATKEKPQIEDGVIEQSMYNGKILVKFFGPTEDKPNRHIYTANGERKTGVTTFIGIVDKSRALMSWKGQLTVGFLLRKLKEGKIDESIICAASIVDEIEKDEAAKFGSEIHDWCERYIKAKLKIKGYTTPEMPESREALNGVTAFLDWEKEHKVKFVSSERVVYSKKHDYIGKMDIEAYVDGDLCLVDLKSSNGLYNPVRMQTAAYLKGDEEERGKKIYTGRWAVRLAKYDEKEYFQRENLKKEVKRLIALYLKRDFKDYEIPAYQVFEAKYLDEKKGDIENDFEAFLHAKALFQWNKETDFWVSK